MKKPTILIVDDEKNILTSLSRSLSGNYHIKTSLTGEEALTILKDNEIDLVLLDVKLPGIDGLDVLKKAMELDKDLVVIVMSAHATTIDDAVKAIKLGAFDYLEKPFSSLENVELKIRHTLEYRDLKNQYRGSKEKKEEEYQIIGNSTVVNAMLDKIQRIAASPGRVLITGENGTGKELVAWAIHNQSPRKEGPFIKVNCAAIPNELIESELFGHEKGSFTGAMDKRRGKFELADGGTIFLDEIGDMSFPTQAKILRVLTDNAIDRVGGAKPIKVDVRVIAATNKNLEEEILNGNFREDLYYRLNVIPFHVPPLKERKEDIPLLVDYFLKQYCLETQTKARKFNPQAVDLLKQYDWPGNIRELKNIVERVAILSPSDIIDITDIASVLPTTFGFETVRKIVIDSKNIPDKMSLKEMSEQFEKNIILETLIKHNWNVTKAADSLELERSHLYKKMRSYGITRDMESN